MVIQVEYSDLPSPLSKHGEVMPCFHIQTTAGWWCFFLCIVVWLIDWKKCAAGSKPGMKMTLLSQKENTTVSLSASVWRLYRWIELSWGGKKTLFLVLVLFLSLKHTDLGAKMPLPCHKEDYGASVCFGFTGLSHLWFYFVPTPNHMGTYIMEPLRKGRTQQKKKNKNLSW